MRRAVVLRAVFDVLRAPPARRVLPPAALAARAVFFVLVEVDRRAEVRAVVALLFTAAFLRDVVLALAVGAWIYV